MNHNITKVLRAAYYHLPPWTRIIDPGSSEKKKNPILEGLGPNIFFEIAKSLGFRYALVHQDDGSPGGMLPNGSWNGLSGAIHKNVSIAMFVSLVVLLITSSLRVHRDSKEVRLSTVGKREYYRLIFAFISAMFMEGTPRSPSGGQARILYGMWWMTVILLGNAFCGLFRAGLMFRPPGERIRDLEHLSTLTETVTPLIIHNSAYEMYFKQCTSHAHKKILDVIQHKHGGMHYEDLFTVKTLQRVVRGEAVIVNEELMTTQRVGAVCASLGAGNFHLTKASIYPHEFAWGVRKDFDPTLLDLINRRIRWLRESHIVYKWIEKENRNYFLCTVSGLDPEPLRPLSTQDTSIIFYIYLVSASFSLGFFCLELFLGTFQINRRENQEQKVDSNLPKWSHCI